MDERRELSREGVIEYMSTQFIRLFDRSEEKEILVNVAMIWKIEIEYAIANGKTAWKTTIKSAEVDPNAMRFYRIFVGNEDFILPAHNTPVMQVLEDIYKSAIKA